MSISIVFARGLVAEFENRGLDAAALLRRSEIDARRLEDIRQMLHPEESHRLAKQAVELSGDPALGLAVGASETEGTFQVFGHLLRAQRNVRDAFAVHKRYASLVARGPVWNLTESGDLAYFTLTPALRDTPYRRFIMDFAITATMRLCRTFFPRPPEGETLLRAVWFQHDAPTYADKYRLYIRCPVKFAQRTNAIVFPREYLDRPQVHADATVSRILREAADRLVQEQEREECLHERVRLLLRYSVDLQEITASHVARAFGLTLRTLRRRLANEGHSLSELIGEARRRVACEALLRDDVSLPAVAEMVGFSEPSAFFRAFKRWTGQTPSEYRRLAMMRGGETSNAAG
ncbi:MAG: AraC family transcriptional regulator [Polyangiales bacterium]